MAKLVRPEDFKNRVLISSDLEQHLAHVQHYVDMGFDEVHLHNVGRNQAEFIEVFGREVLPNLKLDGSRRCDPDGSGDVAGACRGRLIGSPTAAWSRCLLHGAARATSLGRSGREETAATQTRPATMRPVPRRFARAASGGFIVAALVTALLPALPALAKGPIKVTGHQIETSVDHQRIVRLPDDASHVALAWTGASAVAEPHVTIAFGSSPNAARRGGPRRGDRWGRAAGRSRPDGACPRAPGDDLERRHLDGRREVRPDHHRPLARARDRDGDRRPGGQGLRRDRDPRCACGDEGAEHLLTRPVGCGRVAPLRLRRPRDLAGRVLADAEGDRPPHRRPEPRPEPRGHGPGDLLPEGRRQRLRRHRLQLPDRRAGPDLRGPVLARLRTWREPQRRGPRRQHRPRRPRPQLQRRNRRDRAPRELPEPTAHERGPERAGEAAGLEAGAARPEPEGRIDVHEPHPRDQQVPQQHLRPSQRQPDRLPGQRLLPQVSRAAPGCRRSDRGHDGRGR